MSRATALRFSELTSSASTSALTNSFLHLTCPGSPPSPDPQCLSMLEQCSSMKELKQIHAPMITTGHVRFTYITSRIVAFCALSPKGNLEYAHQLFDLIEHPTIFNWNTMIKGYSGSPEPEKGLWFYTQMLTRGVYPNMHTFPITLKSCVGLSSLSQGRGVHGQLIKLGFDLDVFVTSSLIRMYSKCGDVNLARQVFDKSPSRNIVSWTSLISGYCGSGLLDAARKLFDQMPERNDVSWSAMIAGYVQNYYFQEAIELFRSLKLSEDAKPNRSALVSVLTACAALGAFEEGRWVHVYIDENGFDYGLEIGTALIDFYAKCGYVEIARQVFDKMPKKDVLAWSAMVVGLGINGYSHSALLIFAEMEKAGVQPNSVTFIGVLSACNHGGLVDEGWVYFENMSRVHEISPTIEHYGCMVDLLGRAGRITAAEELINRMPMEPDAVIWGALLNGCLMHGYVELGERVGKHLIDLDPEHSGRYVLLANMFAGMGKWEGVVNVRKMMRQRGVTVIPGCSFIEINGVIHRFLVDDKSHPQSEDIYMILNEVNKDLSLSSYCKVLIKAKFSLFSILNSHLLYVHLYGFLFQMPMIRS